PAVEMALLARHIQVVSLSAGAVVQRQYQPPDFVYFPHEGVVSLLAATPDGQSIEAASVGRGGAVLPILKSDVRNGLLTGVALGPMVVARIAQTHLQTVRMECHELNRSLRVCREALLLQILQNVVCGALHSVERRLSRWLLATADHGESDL